MAKVIITKKLEAEINKKFKQESVDIISLMLNLETNPKKGNFLGSVGGIAIKELKYKKFRFYFLTDNYKVKFLNVEDLKDLIMIFVRISEKKDQQKTIDEIKRILRTLGEEAF
ncbi:MAG: hypothetical protein CMH63_02520 [Nanoarchaeota archaeon]|jgi:hypothetical protein|nr:hypothetical protein [Nanoarchaeota archaeon]|tara:strand:+ start:5124 stop:5462 length:339 start_codon:yes stop_codon:yes gene_type:complete